MRVKQVKFKATLTSARVWQTEGGKSMQLLLSETPKLKVPEDLDHYRTGGTLAVLGACYLYETDDQGEQEDQPSINDLAAKYERNDTMPASDEEDGKRVHKLTFGKACTMEEFKRIHASIGKTVIVVLKPYSAEQTEMNLDSGAVSVAEPTASEPAEAPKKRGRPKKAQ